MNFSLAARILLTFISWLFVLAIIHYALHYYAPQLGYIFAHPAEQFLAATLGLSSLIYLFIWSLPHINRPTWKLAFTIFIWSMLIVIGNGVTHLGEAKSTALFLDLQEMMGFAGFALLACTYALFLAMPFVAGVEVGLLIMAIFGVNGVLVAYCGTIIGLNLAFLVGRLLPISRLNEGLEKFGLQQGGEDFDSLLERLTSGKSWLSRFGGSLLRNRYLTLGLCFNFPGNFIVGGGGGLSMLAGTSRRLIYWPYFLLVSIIAPLPVPLLVLIGFLNIEGMAKHSGWLHTLLNAIVPF
jgi:hypothetical protein